MGKKFLSMAIALVVCLTFAFGLGNDRSGNTESGLTARGDTTQSSGVTQSAEAAVTMREIADFLTEKEAHYPLSDEFIERYQQASGGYIDLAKKTAGMVVDKEKHEPNQKWHFFDSWLYPSIEDGSLTWDASAKTRVYSNLLCPELLLWIYEASGVDPDKVRAAKTVAEQGRVAGTKVATIAKNMRACVPWEDIENSVKNFTPAERVTLNPDKLTLTVGDSGTVTATPVSSSATGAAVWSITQGDDLITITPDGNTVTVNAVAKGVAKIKVCYTEALFAECTVTVNEPYVPVHGTSVKYTLSGTSTAQIKTAENALAAFTLVGDGDGIIESVSAIEYIYGGGSGGSGDAKWSSTDMIKLGTGSVLGSITLSLNAQVSRVIITGYVHNTKCEIRVGDGNSTDWTDEENDGKTTAHVCSDMNVVSKDAIDAGAASTITIDFESASSVRIATINTTGTKYPLYITAIEFVLSAHAAQQ